MKEVIKTVKSEIERLKPIVEEYYRLENLLAFLEGPNKDSIEIDTGTIKKRGNHGAIELRVDASMPEEIRNKYNLSIGDTFNSAQELSRLIHVDKNLVYRWRDRDGYLKATKNNKRVYNHNTAVKVTNNMMQKLQIKYNIHPGDFWHSVNDMRDKLGISGPTVTYWRKAKYIEFFNI